MAADSLLCALFAAVAFVALAHPVVVRSAGVVFSAVLGRATHSDGGSFTLVGLLIHAGLAGVLAAVLARKARVRKEARGSQEGSDTLYVQ